MRVNTLNELNKIRLLTFVGGLIVCLSSAVWSQTNLRIAIVTPEKNFQVEGLRNELIETLEDDYRIIERELSESIFAESDFERPFNLTREDAIGFGLRSGANYLILLRSTRNLRISKTQGKFYETFVAAFVVSTRTGRLRNWVYENYEADDPIAASNLLNENFPKQILEIHYSIIESEKEELAKKHEIKFVASDLEKPAMPYSRISPKYTSVAARYKIEATIDAIVEIDSKGKVINIIYERWAGYELEASVGAAIMQMNWRPGSDNGVFLPSRVLLRYNFADIQDSNQKPLVENRD